MGVEQHPAEDALMFLRADLQRRQALTGGKNGACGTLVGHRLLSGAGMPGFIARAASPVKRNPCDSVPQSRRIRPEFG
jgi:hypothetical protein